MYTIKLQVTVHLINKKHFCFKFPKIEPQNKKCFSLKIICFEAFLCVDMCPARLKPLPLLTVRILGTLKLESQKRRRKHRTTRNRTCSSTYLTDGHYCLCVCVCTCLLSVCQGCISNHFTQFIYRALSQKILKCVIIKFYKKYIFYLKWFLYCMYKMF